MENFVACLAFLQIASIAIADDAEVRTAIAAYRSNATSFEALSCRYEIRAGFANSREEAVAGKLTGCTTNTARWLVAEGRVLFVTTCDESLTADATERLQNPTFDASGEGSVSIPCHDETILRSSSRSLFFVPLMASANLETLEGKHRLPTITPFGRQPEQLSVADCLTIGLQYEGYESKYIGVSRDYGSTETLEFEVHKDGEAMANFAVDPARGFLPIYSNDGTEQHITDIRECSGGRWFPMRTVIIRNPKAPYIVDEVTVVELDPQAVLSDADFSVKLPARTQVNVPHEDHFMTLDADRSVSVAELDKLYDDCVVAGQEYVAQVRNAQRYNEALERGAGRRSWAWVNLAVLLLAGAGVVWWRFRSPKGGGVASQ